MHMNHAQKALTKKKPFSMLMASGILITAAQMKGNTRKFSATMPSGIKVHSPEITFDENGNVLSVLSANKKTPLSADDLIIAADVTAISAGLAKATLVSNIG